MSNYKFSIDKVDPDLDIDFMDLQPAVAMQASLYGYYSELAVDARAERDSAVDELTKAEGEVELEIRKTAEESKQKLTIPEVTAKVASHPRLVELRAVVVEKNRAFLKLDSKVKALDHKRSMIESAVRMVVSRSNGISSNGVAEDWSNEDSTRTIRNQLNRR
jgi:hypothetical protein